MNEQIKGAIGKGQKDNKKSLSSLWWKENGPNRVKLRPPPNWAPISRRDGSGSHLYCAPQQQESNLPLAD